MIKPIFWAVLTALCLIGPAHAALDGIRDIGVVELLSVLLAVLMTCAAGLYASFWLLRFVLIKGRALVFGSQESIASEKEHNRVHSGIALVAQAVLIAWLVYLLRPTFGGILRHIKHFRFDEMMPIALVFVPPCVTLWAFFRGLAKAKTLTGKLVFALISAVVLWSLLVNVSLYLISKTLLNG